MLKSVFILLRPKQWIKNCLVFAALIFSRNVFHSDLVLKAVFAFILFCLVSSAAYILNDILDLKEDRQHPWKRMRPLASGQVPVRLAAVLVGVFLLFSGFFAWVIQWKLFVCLAAYFIVQMTYSFGLKHVVLWDVMLLSCGFVIRAIAGGMAIGVGVSNWLLLCTFLLALFLALCKRRQELVVLEDKASDHRPVLAEYSLTFIDSLLSVITGATVVSYALYTVSPEVIRKFHTDRLIFTVPFVLYGIFRYLYLVHQRSLGDNPTQVFFTDVPLLVGIMIWLLSCVFIIYLR